MTSFHFPDSGLYLSHGFDFYFDLFWLAWHWKPAIWYLKKCFAYAFYQNKDNEKGLKQSFEVIIPHAFGDHSKCGLEWCGKLKIPSGYKHVVLQDGQDLQGAALKKCLTDVIEKYTTPDMLKKYAPLSSQKNETANSIIGTKSLKIRYYGGSETNDLQSCSRCCTSEWR